MDFAPENEGQLSPAMFPSEAVTGAHEVGNRLTMKTGSSCRDGWTFPGTKAQLWETRKDEGPLGSRDHHQSSRAPGHHHGSSSLLPQDCRLRKRETMPLTTFLEACKIKDNGLRPPSPSGTKQI